MVLLGRIELPTSALPRMRSTTELQQPTIRTAGRRQSQPAGARYWPCTPDLSTYREQYNKGQHKRMPTDDKTGTPGKPSREDRLAAKLRENLHRRKAQARALDNAATPALPKGPVKS